MTIPEQEQDAITRAVQRSLVESGIPALQVLAVDADGLIGRVEYYRDKR